MCSLWWQQKDFQDEELSHTSKVYVKLRNKVNFALVKLLKIKMCLFYL